MKNEIIASVRHGLILSVAALLCGAFWAAYMATHHEQLHSAFEAQEAEIQSAQMGHLMEDLSMGTMQMDHAHETGAVADHGHQSHDAGEHATDGQHSHSGSLAKDAMQRLLRGHIHFMGIGVLAAVLLLVTAFTSLKPCWKKVMGWTFGLGALAYPPVWILMGFRTVELGPQAAEASVMWLFGPAVGLLLASMSALFVVLILEAIGVQYRLPVLKWFFSNK
jgi:hypothetical protein